MFKDKVLLITGGTGSFGKAVLKKFIDTDIREIRIFSRDEKKQHDMRVEFNNSKIKFFIGDIRDYASIDFAMKGVDFVFHAAALKQVPSCEFFPLEAVKTNILGTENVLDSAIKNKVKKVIALSTDKAVYPVNSMGMTKGMMEKVMIAKSRTLGSEDTLLCGTRYGNVMASRGSVIPLFVEQIKGGNALTITDPSMTRFMMSLEEAVDLVLFAFENAKQGDIFVQKAPGATVSQVANALLKIFKSDVGIEVIGTRQGEKKHETLLSKEEIVRSEDLGKFYRVACESRDLNDVPYFEKGVKELSENEDYTSENTCRLSDDELISLLLKLGCVSNGVE
ncbi:UDP-glucose 4-epimerase [Halobacteriovorax marinus]|uniref:polysaccharide biosynthesis protein n=1 Tax=Halobacteriovorax marinus TaxID=97084 RepID=UPI000BC2ECC4|nr:polysaccharide biosynthesis protein [Halobacteriovorax marinus]ATH06716.1 UDP-glucose 4-epimerase [Halobacteriovorax marinus]